MEAAQRREKHSKEALLQVRCSGAAGSLPGVASVFQKDSPEREEKFPASGFRLPGCPHIAIRAISSTVARASTASRDSVLGDRQNPLCVPLGWDRVCSWDGGDGDDGDDGDDL
ncbi:hypothetical protein E4U41_002217 [Claviceps citrina]|nr:hypothetical protein E4U41_002217 [Claviceps citrina]